jgi:hypothetical protein
MQRSTPILLLSLVAIAFLSAGCSSGGGKGMKTSDSILDTAKRLDDGRTQIDRVVASLNRLTTAQPNDDLRPLFRDYSSDVDKLDSIAQNVKRQADQMRSRGQTYFQQWNAELANINNEDIRSQSAQRRQDVESSFARISEHSQSLRDSYRPLMSDLQDIRTALNADLTPGGIASIRPIAERVANEAAAVKNAAGSIEAEFRSLGVQMSAAGR